MDTDLADLNNADTDPFFLSFMNPPLSPSAYLNYDVNSENEPGLPDDEQDVDLSKYVDCLNDNIEQGIIPSEHERFLSNLHLQDFSNNIKQENISSEHEASINHFLDCPSDNIKQENIFSGHEESLNHLLDCPSANIKQENIFSEHEESINHLLDCPSANIKQENIFSEHEESINHLLDCPSANIKQENNSNEQEGLLSNLLKSRTLSNITQVEDFIFQFHKKLNNTLSGSISDRIPRPDIIFLTDVEDEPILEKPIISDHPPSWAINEEEEDPDNYILVQLAVSRLASQNNTKYLSSLNSNTSSDEDDILDVDTITDLPKAVEYLCSHQDPSPVVMHATKPQNKTVCIDDVNPKRRPVGRPRKRPLEALAVQPSTSQNNPQLQASCSRSEYSACSRSEYSAASYGFSHGLKQNAVNNRNLCKTLSQPVEKCSCTTCSMNFHDYTQRSSCDCALSKCRNDVSSQTATETARPTVVARRQYRRKTTVDEVDKEKQNHHNQLERNRRQKLANLLIKLREKVPSIAHNDKASKVVVLKEATSYIWGLRKKDECQKEQISREEETMKQLKKVLQQLEYNISNVVR